MPQASSQEADLKPAWSAFGSGFAHLLLKEAPRAWRGGADQVRFRAEREKILHHLQPIGMGVFVTVFCFATFRISGSRWWIRIRDTYFRSPLDASSSISRSSNQGKDNFTSHLSRETEKKQAKINELMQLPLDLTLSMIIGSSAFLLLFDSEKLQEDVIQIPLLPGQSLAHGCVCPGVVQAVQAHHLSISNDSQAENDDVTRKFFSRFAENCQTRSRYLEHRKNHGLPNPELVPYPGLKGWIK